MHCQSMAESIAEASGEKPHHSHTLSAEHNGRDCLEAGVEFALPLSFVSFQTSINHR
jgi:hypothetical protein